MSEEANFHTKQKIKAFETWMVDDHVLIHFDSRAEGVLVPEHIQNNPALTLKLSYLFQGETKHNNTEITTYLKFNSEYFQCVIPWNSVWGITSSNEENTIWPEDLPRELVFQFAKAKVKEIGSKLFNRKDNSSSNSEEEQEIESDEKPTSRPTLHAVDETEPSPKSDKNEENKPSGPTPINKGATKGKRNRPHLKRVK